jgi:NitT/TauT family transport system substrate-binding protein
MRRHSLARSITLTSALLAGLLTLTACGSSNDAANGSSSPQAPSSTAGQSPSTASTPAGPAPSGTAPATPPSQPFPKLTIGTPGIPPVISSLLPYIADKKGFYKAFGVDVTVKNFQTGTDATRALSTGQIDIAIVPPAQQIQLAAKGIGLTGIMGQEKPDWVVVSSDGSIDSCQKLKGQSLGVDAIGGIRYIALAQMLKTCGLTIKDVHPLVFSGNANPQAMIAGQLKVSVLHLNEKIDVEQHSGKTLTTVMSMATAVPSTMYEIFGVQSKRLSELRDALVRFDAAQIATLNWMFDPANADEVAQLGTVVGDSAQTMKAAMQQYQQIGFWTLNDAGMPEANLDNMVKGQVAVGNVKADKAPKAAQLIDTSVYQDAQKLVQP